MVNRGYGLRLIKRKSNDDRLRLFCAAGDVHKATQATAQPPGRQRKRSGYWLLNNGGLEQVMMVNSG